MPARLKFSSSLKLKKNTIFIGLGIIIPIQIYRNSHQRCSVKKVVLRNFTKFTGKHLCQSLSFNCRPQANFIKKETLAQVFSCEFCKISKNTFFTEHLWTTASEVKNKWLFGRNIVRTFYRNHLITWMLSNYWSQFDHCVL